MSQPRHKMVSLFLPVDVLEDLKRLAAELERDPLDLAADFIAAVVEDDKAAHGLKEAA